MSRNPSPVFLTLKASRIQNKGQMLQISILLFLQLISSLEANDNGDPTFRMRLPDSVTPLHYDLQVHPNLTFLNFTGTVKIQLEVQLETKHIFLHSKNLHISRALLLGSRHLHLLQVHESEPFEQISLSSAGSAFTRGLHVIQLDFSANLSESFHGFYKGTYTTRSGEVRYWDIYGASLAISSQTPRGGQYLVSLW